MTINIVDLAVSEFLQTSRMTLSGDINEQGDGIKGHAKNGYNNIINDYNVNNSYYNNKKKRSKVSDRTFGNSLLNQNLQTEVHPQAKKMYLKKVDNNSCFWFIVLLKIGEDILHNKKKIIILIKNIFFESNFGNIESFVNFWGKNIINI